MDNLALSFIERNVNFNVNGFSPFAFPGRNPSVTRISNYIAPVQFERWSHDIAMWRDAIREAELAYYPQRVKMMRMYIDAVESLYVKSLMQRSEELTLQRGCGIYQKKGGVRVKSEVLTQTLEDKMWFYKWMKFALAAEWWGYTLIEMGDIVDNDFPYITFTRRQNIRPDGVGDGAVLTSMIYGINGINVQNDPLITMCNHWIPTESDIGVSVCGYGLLYPVSFAEIHLRHLTEWNVDNLEIYGQPIRKGFTTKTGAERDEFENMLRYAGQSTYVVLDKAQDDVQFEFNNGGGTSWKGYAELKRSIKGELSQYVLGHEDAMSSSPGKLGGNQTANKDGFNESLIEQAMNAKQIVRGNFLERAVNDVFAPNMRRLGRYLKSRQIQNYIPEGYFFALENDKEEQEIRRRINSDRLTISTYVEKMSNGGYKVDVKSLTDWFGMPLTEQIPERGLIEQRDTKTEIKKDLPDNKTTI